MFFDSSQVTNKREKGNAGCIYSVAYDEDPESDHEVWTGGSQS